MSDPINAIVGSTSLLGGSILGAEEGAVAAARAADAQSRASAEGINESRRQLEIARELLKPYIDSGYKSLEAQQALLSLGDPDIERRQIESVEQSPTFQALLRKGEEALLQNASAIGGLRGGNTQAAIAEFRPNLLAQQLENRFRNLGTLSTLGQNSATLSGSYGQNTASNIADLLGAQGAAQAGGILGQQRARSQIYSLPSQALGFMSGMGGGGSIF